MSRIPLLIIFATLLWGCAADNATWTLGSAPRTLALAPNDPRGVLIIGVPRSVFLGYTSRRQIDVLEFQSYDPISNRLISPNKGGRAFKLSRGGLLFHTVDRVDGYQYIVQPFPAGHYYLTKVYWPDTGQSLLPDGSVAVEILPGKVTYPGNLRFRVPFTVFGNAKVVLGPKNDRVASTILGKYPNLKADVRASDLRLIKLDCSIEKGVESCYAP